jgi:hypothetical protein
MIPLGSVLQSRTKGSPPMKVNAIEGSRYCLQPLTFGPTISLGIDELAARFDTSGHTLEIEEFDEAAAWLKLTTERVGKGFRAADRRQREQDAEESPEQHFARVAREDANGG